MYNIGIDLGGTNIVASVVDDKYNIIATGKTPTAVPRSAEEIRECCFIRPECVETVGESKRYTLFDRRITDRFRAERFEIRGEAQFEGEGLRVLIVTAGSGTVEAGSFRMDLQPFDRVLVPAATAQLRFRSETGLELVAAMPPAAE